MKGQAATELLTLIGIGLLIIIPLFYFTLLHSSQSTSQLLATDAVNTIANNADYLYSLGNQSATTVNVRLPEGLVSASVKGKAIILKLSTSAGVTDVFAVTKANLTGSLPAASGNYLIKLQNINSIINISR